MNTGAIMGIVIGTIGVVCFGFGVLVIIGGILYGRKHRHSPPRYRRLPQPLHQPTNRHVIQLHQQPPTQLTADPTLTEAAPPPYDDHQNYPPSTEPPSTDDGSSEPPTYESSDVSFNPPVDSDPPTAVPYPAVPAVI